jgi:hypothetical protein
MMPKEDQLQSQIEELILEANDPKDKAFLLILNKIANNLDENTTLTRTLTTDLHAHTEAFAKHEKDEMALINQGRGGFRVALAALALFQTIATGLGAYAFHDFQAVKGVVHGVAQEMAIHKEHHRLEEALNPNAPRVK